MIMLIRKLENSYIFYICNYFLTCGSALSSLTNGRSALSRVGIRKGIRSMELNCHITRSRFDNNFGNRSKRKLSQYVVTHAPNHITFRNREFGPYLSKLENITFLFYTKAIKNWLNLKTFIYILQWMTCNR